MKLLIYKLSDYRMVKNIEEYKKKYIHYKHFEEEELYNGSDEFNLFYLELNSIEELYNLIYGETGKILLLKDHYCSLYSCFVPDEDKNFFDGIIEIYDTWRE